MNNDNHDSSLGVDNEDNKEIMLKEIDLIQSCINRMSQNSFIIKGWAISLNGIIVALFADKGHPIITQIICIVSILCFWYLDAFFLLAEKLYRWKYEWVISNRLTSKECMYDLDPHNSKMWIKNQDGNDKVEPSVGSVMWTDSLRYMYVAILIVNIVLLVMAIANWIGSLV